MESVACPSCGQSTTGAFCAHCGTAVRCRECATTLLSDARFCTECGTPVPSSSTAATLGEAEPVEPPRKPSRLPWAALGGVALVALAGFLIIPRLREPRQEAPASELAGQPAPAGDARSVDIASMTPQERADRLFDRVMRSMSEGDSAGARQFVPMALAAYGMAGAPNADARYHMGALHLVGGDPASARAQADTLLASNPRHLFGLFTAAEAEQARGNTQGARELYRRFLDAYDAEIARNLPEYQAHQPALPGMRSQATRVAGA